MALDYPKGLEATIHSQSTGRPFKKCPVCNLQQIPQSAASCWECERLTAMKVAIPKDPGSGVQDTQKPQSYPSNDHSGFSTTAPQGKFPKDKERV